MLEPSSAIPAAARPRTRADCAGGPRPCQWLACRHHLASEHPTASPEETCTLDVADRGGVTLEEVGDIMGVTRERIRQIEKRALNKLRADPGVLPECLDP